MREGESLLLVSGRSGSDIDEYNFGHILQTSIYECRKATSHESDILPINNIFSVNSKSNTSGSDVFASGAFSIMKPKVDKKGEDITLDKK